MGTKRVYKKEYELYITRVENGFTLKEGNDGKTHVCRDNEEIPNRLDDIILNLKYGEEANIWVYTSKDEEVDDKAETVKEG